MHLSIDLPDTVYDLLAHAHPKGAEAAASIAIKRYLKAVANSTRDQEIADKAVAGTPQTQLAKDYDLSYVRIQQIVAKGRADAYARQYAKQTDELKAIFDFDHPNT